MSAAVAKGGASTWPWLLRVSLPLALGTLLYGARPSRPVAFDAAPTVARALHAALHPLARHLPRVVLASLPDAAWAFALASGLALVWRGAPSRARVAWLAAGGVFALGWELAQLPRWIPGTFDVLDLIASALGYAGAIALFTTAHKENP